MWSLFACSEGMRRGTVQFHWFITWTLDGEVVGMSVSFTPWLFYLLWKSHQYPFSGRLGGHQVRVDSLARTMNRTTVPWTLVHSSVIILTSQSCLPPVNKTELQWQVGGGQGTVVYVKSNSHKWYSDSITW